MASSTDWLNYILSLNTTIPATFTTSYGDDEQTVYIFFALCTIFDVSMFRDRFPYSTPRRFAICLPSSESVGVLSSSPRATLAWVAGIVKPTTDKTLSSSSPLFPPHVTSYLHSIRAHSHRILRSFRDNSRCVLLSRFSSRTILDSRNPGGTVGLSP